MAISILKQPSNFQPIHNPILLEAVSNQTAQTNFRYKVTLSVVGFLPRTLYISPRPVDWRLEVDLAIHLRDYLDYNNFTLPFSTAFAPAPAVRYSITIRENYNGSDQGTPVTIATTTATNVVLTRPEWLQNKATNFQLFYCKQSALLPGDPKPKILLNKGLGAPMYKDEFYLLHVPGTQPGTSVLVSQYNANGVLVYPQYSIPSTLSDNVQFCKLDLSTISWNANAKFVGVTMLNTDGEITEEKQFRIKDYVCTSFERWKLVFVDRYGSLNNLSLGMVSSSSFEVDPKTYRKRINFFNESGRSRALTRYHQSADRKFILNSDILHEDEAVQIEELLQSTIVFRDVRGVEGFEGLDFYPVEVLTKQMTPFAPGANELPQYKIEIRYSHEENIKHE